MAMRYGRRRRVRRRSFARRFRRRFTRRRYSKYRAPGERSRYAAGGGIAIRRSFTPGSLQGNDTYAPFYPGLIYASGVWQGVNTWRLSDVINKTDFTNLFNEYCITGVKMSFHLRRLQNSSTTNATSTMPTLYYYTDPDGNGISPTTVENVLERSNMQRRLLNPEKPVQIYIPYPRVSQKLYQSTLTEGFAVAKPNQWIPTENPDVPHYGFGWLIDEHRNTGNYIDIVVTYYFKFRGAK